MKLLVFFLAIYFAPSLRADTLLAEAKDVFSCIPDCTAHGCFLRCEARWPTYGESMRFPNLLTFKSKADCEVGCTCKNYPVGPRLPDGSVSCQVWVDWPDAG